MQHPANNAVRHVVGDVSVCLGLRRLERGNDVTSLTENEAVVLAVLIEAYGEVVSREDLAVALGYSRTARTRAVDATVSRLRAKIEADPRNPELLETVYGHGYRLVPPEPTLDGSPLKTTIPRFTGAFVGRVAETQRLFRTLRLEGHVTVLGVPGVGKTHLVAQAVSSWRQQDPQRAVIWVRGRDAGALPALAQTLLNQARLLVEDGIAQPQTLLVIDQAEAHGDELAQVVRALDWEAPHVRTIAVGSRPIGLRRETLLRVGGLPGSDALALLSRGADERLDRQAALEEIVDLLGGHPLALARTVELLDLLPAQTLRSRLQADPLGTLGSQGGALREAVDRFVAALSPADRADLVRFEPYVAGIDVRTAERLLSPHERFPLERLQALVDGAVLVPVPDTRGRFRVSWLARLALDHPDLAPTPSERRSARDAWLRDAETRAAALIGQPATAEHLDALRSEWPNLDVARASGELPADAVADLLVGLGPVVAMEGDGQRHLEHLQRWLEQNEGPNPKRALVLAAASRWARALGEHARGSAIRAELADAVPETDSCALFARADQLLLDADRGQLDSRAVLLTVDAARALRPSWSRTLILEGLATALARVDRPQAEALLAEVLDQHTHFDDTAGRARVLGQLALVRLRLGRVVDARDTRSLALDEMRTAPRSQPDVGLPVATAFRLAGELDTAEELIRDGLCRCIQRQWPTAPLRAELGWILLERAEYAAAEQALIEARRWFADRGLVRPASEASRGLILGHLLRGDHDSARDYADWLASRTSTPEAVLAVALQRPTELGGSLGALVQALVGRCPTTRTELEAVRARVQGARRTDPHVRLLWLLLVRRTEARITAAGRAN